MITYSKTTLVSYEALKCPQLLVLVGVVSEEIWNCPELEWAKGL